MIHSKKKGMDTKTMVMGAVMTALVIVFQLISTYTTFFGPFSTAMALIPIVIGTALCGVVIGGWLGFVFGMVVILTGGAALFWPFSIIGSIVTVLAKGIACGVAAGLVYRALAKWNRYLAVLAAAIACPLANTGVFLVGCTIFFLPSASGIAAVLGWSTSGMEVFWALAMGNFIFELGINVFISPLIVRLLAQARIK
jgi:uncharacterized membrane protein